MMSAWRKLSMSTGMSQRGQGGLTLVLMEGEGGMTGSVTGITGDGLHVVLCWILGPRVVVVRRGRYLHEMVLGQSFQMV